MPTMSVSARERRTLARLRRDIRRRGVALAEGCACRDQEHRRILYTVGLTRHHGHPELVVSGRELRGGTDLLLDAAAAVAAGDRLAPGWDLVTDRGEYRIVEVDDPEHLWLAQLMYAPALGPPVPALHLIGR